MEELKDKVEAMLREEELTLEDVSAVMTGINANNNACYHETTDVLFPDVPLLHYKHLFGENYTASAFGVYASAHCLKNKMIPACLYDESTPRTCDSLQNIVVLNQMNGEYSLILLRKV